MLKNKTLERLLRLIQTGRGHAPCANGSAHQIHLVLALRQPVAKNKAIQRPENQALGPASGSGNDTHGLGAQAMLLKMGQGLGAGIDAQGLLRESHPGIVADSRRLRMSPALDFSRYQRRLTLLPPPSRGRISSTVPISRAR